MPLTRPATRPVTRSLVRVADSWSVGLQQRARRNAMVALTACTRRRSEREDVEAYLAARAAARAAARRTPAEESSVSLHA